MKLRSPYTRASAKDFHKEAMRSKGKWYSFVEGDLKFKIRAKLVKSCSEDLIKIEVFEYHRLMKSSPKTKAIRWKWFTYFYEYFHAEALFNLLKIASVEDLITFILSKKAFWGLLATRTFHKLNGPAHVSVFNNKLNGKLSQFNGYFFVLGSNQAIPEEDYPKCVEAYRYDLGTKKFKAKLNDLLIEDSDGR